MDLEWTIGPISRGANILLSTWLSVYTAAIGYNAWRAVQNHLEDRWSSVFATVAGIALSAVFWLRGEVILPAPFNVFVLFMAASAVILMFTYTLGRFQEKIARFEAETGQRLNTLLEDMVPAERLAAIRHWRQRMRPDKELFRKTPHLMMGIFIPIYLVLGQLVFLGIWTAFYGGSPGTGESASNLHAALEHATMPWLVGGQVFALMLLVGLFVFVAPNEFLRLRYPELSYPFKQTILRAMRKKEEGLFAAHLYILLALPLAIIGLTWNPDHWSVTIPAVLAMVAVTVFADAASALFGRRWGRTKWPHTENKSYVGTFAGALVAIVVAVPFVGLPMALVTALVFVVIDALAPHPLPVTDNILNPVGLALAYSVTIPWLAPLIPLY